MRAKRACAVHALERRVLGDALRAEHLDRAVDHVVQHLRAEDLDHADLDPRLVAAVDLLRGRQGEQPARLDLAQAVEDELLDLLVLAERLAEGHARVRALAHQVERALRLAEPAHAVEDAARARAGAARS